MKIGEAFDRAVGHYDDWIRIAVPGYPQIFEVAVSSLPFGEGAEIAVLDLGAGTGLFTSHLLQRYPSARCVLVDLAPEMLALARQRLADREGLDTFLHQDYLEGDLPAERDLVISSLSIHHLAHADKRALFARVAALLKPGGIFLNIDQIRAPSDALAVLYWEDWIARVRAAGGSEEQLRESIERRRAFDVDASLKEQLEWLGEAGFAEVDLLYKFGFVGLFRARAPG